MKKLIYILFTFFCIQNPALAFGADSSSAASDLEDHIQQDFTNTIMRAFEVSGESPDHYLNNILKKGVERLSSDLNRLFQEDPQLLETSTPQIKELLFIKQALEVSLESMNESEAFYKRVTPETEPRLVRQRSFQLMIDTKKKLIAIFKNYLDWVQDSENITQLAQDTEFNSRVIHIAFTFQSLLSHRFQTSFEEHDLFIKEVAEPLSEMLVSHMRWYTRFHPDRLAYFNYLFFDNLSTNSPSYQPIFKKLIPQINHPLWTISPDTSQSYQSYAAFNFVINNPSVSDLDSMNLDIETLISKSLSDEEKDIYHRAWEAYFPQSLLDYLVSDRNSMTHVEFLTHFKRIKDQWRNYSTVLKEAGLTLPVKTNFGQYMLQKFSNMDSWRDKSIEDLFTITHYFFANHVPAPSDEQDRPFAPSVKSVIASHTNPKSILNTAVYNLTQSQPLMIRMFFERFISDFLKLSDIVSYITGDDLSELNTLLDHYGKLNLKSRIVESLALSLNQSDRAHAETRILAAHYLLRVNPSKYSFVKESLKKISPVPMRLKLNPYTLEVRVVENPNSQGEEAAYGDLVHSISPYALSQKAPLCSQLLSL